MTALFIAMSVLPFAAQGAADEPLQVMTWNIRYDNPSDGPDAWPHRKDWVAEIVDREQADIAGFQEVLASQLEDLKSRLPKLGAYGVGRDDGAMRGEFVPIFYRESRFELLDKGTFWLSPTPEKPGSKGWDAAITRIVSWVKLKDKRSPKTLFVLNAHFDHRGTEARLKSAELILERVRTQFAAHPTFLLGDLNTTGKMPPYGVLAGKDSSEKPILRDAYEHSDQKPEGPDSTWNGFKKVVPGNRIDFVFVTDQVNVLRLRTLEDQRAGRFPSDHLPVVVEVSLKPH